MTGLDRFAHMLLRDFYKRYRASETARATAPFGHLAYNPRLEIGPEHGIRGWPVRYEGLISGFAVAYYSSREAAEKSLAECALEFPAI